MYVDLVNGQRDDTHLCISIPPKSKKAAAAEVKKIRFSDSKITHGEWISQTIQNLMCIFCATKFGNGKLRTCNVRLMLENSTMFSKKKNYIHWNSRSYEYIFGVNLVLNSKCVYIYCAQCLVVVIKL